VALVYTWQAIIDGDGMVTSDEYQPADEGRVLRRMLLGNLVGSGSVPLMRKQAVVEAGGYETALHAAGAQGCEDLLLYFRIAERYQFALVPEHLTGYRQHDRNMSGDLLRTMRSYRMVAREMRLAYPEHQALVSRGEALMAQWLLIHAVRARHVMTAAILLGSILRTNPRYGSTEVLFSPCVSVMRAAVRRARFGPALAPRKAFMAVAPEGHS
jgi:hypothetical protein